MKKHLILLAILALMLPMFAAVFTIGTGTAGSYYAPFNGFYDYNWSKSVYTLAEINAAGLTGAKSITGIGFNVTNTPSNYTMLDQRIYVRHSDIASYASTDNDHPNSALFYNVFQGDLTYNGDGWFQISFSTPFAWNGTQGLEFLFENHDGSYVSGYPSFAYTSMSPVYQTVYKHKDGSFPQGETGTRSYNRPNIQLITPMTTAPGPATLVAPANNASFIATDVSISWNPVVSATGYRVYFGTSPTPPLAAYAGTNTSYSPVGLQKNTTYYWKIEPYNGYGATTNCPVWSFTTMPEGAIIIGDGTATARYPLGSFYGYERSAALYTAAEIGAENKRISSLGWYATQAADDDVPTKIYLKAYTGSALAPANWATLTDGATLVYDANVNGIIADEWNVLTLTNTFDLDSGSKLLVLVERNYGGGGGSAGSNAPAIRSTMMPNMHYTILKDTSPPDDDIMSSDQPARPNIMIMATSYQATVPPNPAIAVSPVNGAEMVPLDTQLNWASGGGAPTGYKLYFGTTLPPTYVGDLGGVSSYDPGMLASDTSYYWRVVPYNNIDDAGGCPIWSFSTMPAGTITVGEGTASSSFPFYSYYEAARTQTLFSLSELNAAGAFPGLIESIGYDVIDANDIVLNDLMIRLKHTNSETLAGFEEGDFSTCYLASEALQGTGWNYFALDTPFLWNGTQNLLVDVSFTNSNYTQNSTVRATAAAGKTWGRYADGQIGSTLTGGSAQVNRPNTRFIFSEQLGGTPAAPILLSPTNGASMIPKAGVTLKWAPDLTNGDAPAGYKFYFGASNPPEFVGVLGNVTAYDSGRLANGTTYYWQVVPYNYLGEAVDCPVWSFSTEPAAMVNIGTGSANQLLPVYPYYKYTYSQSIYLQSEIDMQAQRIEKLSYYWNGATAAPYTKDWVIYMGHTAKNSFVSISDWLPLSELTQVFDGIVNLTDTPGWVEIILQVPFVYNNSQNLVIAVDENTPNYDGPAQFFFSTLSPGQNRSLRYYADLTNPDPASPPIGTLVAAYPNIRLQFGDLPANPVFSYNLTNLDFGSVNYEIASAPKSIKITNIGGGSINCSDIEFSLIGENPEEFSLDTHELPDFLNPGESGYINIAANSSTLGPISAILRMSYAGEDYDVELSATCFPVGMVGIGDGNVNQWLPVYPHYSYSYSQSIYLQSEINMPEKRIEKISYYWNGAVAAPNTKDWVIYMGHTVKNFFSSSSDWLPLSELTQVFAGDVNLTNTPGWVEIILQIPFAYNNSQNLVIAVDENTPNFDGSIAFFFSTVTLGQNRSLRYFADDSNPNPASPPVGTLVSAYPNIRLQFGDLPTSPVLSYSPTNLDFGDVNHEVASAPKNIRIANIGGGSLNCADIAITLIGENPGDFSYNTNELPTTLDPGESAYISVTANSSTLGSISATLRMSYNGVDNDVELSASCLPAGMVPIGYGNENRLLPVYPAMEYTYSQSLYLQSEIDMPDQQIEKLYYYWNGAAAAPNTKDWVIYMGHTNKDSFGSLTDWLPLSELVQVFSGAVNLTNTPGWVEIILQTPFVYNNSQNLVIAVDENTPNYDGNTAFFFSTQSAGRYSSLRFYEVGINPDPSSPPTGMVVDAYPNIRLQFGDRPTNPILLNSPTNLDFGDVNHEVASAPKSIKITNNGGGSLNCADIAISLIGENPGEFSFEDGYLPNVLEPGESAYINVVATASTVGPISATLRMSYDGVDNDVALSAIGLAADELRIGYGNSNQMLPVYHRRGYTYSQSIYLQSEIDKPEKRIEKLSYYWNGAAAAPNTKDWVIYMGHTSKNRFVSTGDWLPLSELTQVFDGIVNLTNTPGWVEITLQIPFLYNNSQNLVIAVDENTPNYDNSSAFFFNTLSPGQNRSLRYNDDEFNPDPGSPPNGNLFAAYPNIIMVFGDLPTSPVLSYSPTNLDFGDVNHEVASAPKNISIANTGVGSLSLADVVFSFTGENSDDFSYDLSELPDALESGESAGFSVSVDASTAGPISATLRMSYNGIDCDVALSAIGLPAGMVGVGNGESNQMLPVSPTSGYTYSQSIFLQSEIDIPNQRIEKLYYYWNGAATALNTKDWLIYMGHTNKNSFASFDDWLPISELVQVFAGSVSLTNTPGWVEIVLNTPFEYNNEQNLVIAVDENTPYYESFSVFFFSTLTPGQNRSLRYCAVDLNPDPVSPPAGTLVAAYPNIRLQFGDLPTSPVLSYNPTNLDFGYLIHEVASAPKNIRIANNGVGSLNTSDISFTLIGENPGEFSFDIGELPDELEPGESGYISVSATPSTAGPISATLRMSYNGIDHDVALSAIGLPVSMVRIGEGNENRALPVNPYYYYTYSQSIFLQSEINTQAQWIGKLYYYWNGAATALNTKDWVIYMGHTAKNSFASPSDWLPLSELIQVYAGDVNLTESPGWVEIVLNTPFEYNNDQNLVIAVDENTPSYDSSSAFFYCTLSAGQYRSLRLYADGLNPDPSSPPAGTMVEAYPNIMLNFEEIAIPSYEAFPVLQANMYEAIPSLDLHEYFSSEYLLEFSCFCEEPIDCEIDADGILSISAPADWHGTSYIRVRATVVPELYVEQILKLVIIEKAFITEDFDNAGSLPAGWAQHGGGNTTIPWQAQLISGNNYELYTSASLGGTVNERLRSTAYNLANLTEVSVSFDSDFLPYANVSGSFSYSLNNMDYTPIESYSTAHNGRKTYQIPAIEGKPSVLFRWTYATDSVNGGEENHWKIDNFTISGVVNDNTAPAPVTGLQITEFHPDYVELSWQPSSDNYFARYEIYISEDDEVDTDDQLWSVEQDANLAFEDCNSTRISGLEPAMYWLAVRAVDFSGNASALSNIVQFYANDGMGPIFSNPIPSSQPSPTWQLVNNVSIGCTIIDNNLIDPNSIMYRIDIDKNGSYDVEEEWQPAFVSRVSRSNQLSKSRSINEDYADYLTEYWVEVPLQFEDDGVFAFEFKAQDVYGNTCYSGMQNAEGIEDDWILRIDLLPPAEMEHFFVQELCGDSVTLGWSASYDTNFMGYMICYGTSPDALFGIWDWTDDANLAESGTGMVSTTITGLQPGTQYWFQLSAWDLANGLTQYPYLISAITSSSAQPQAPQNLRLEVQGGVLSLTWDAVNEDVNGNPIQVNQYHIFAGDHPDFDCDFDSYLCSTLSCSIEMEEIVEYADRKFFKVIAEAGIIRSNHKNVEFKGVH